MRNCRTHVSAYLWAIWIGGLVVKEGLFMYPLQEPGGSNPNPNHLSKPPIQAECGFPFKTPRVA